MDGIVSAVSGDMLSVEFGSAVRLVGTEDVEKIPEFKIGDEVELTDKAFRYY